MYAVSFSKLTFLERRFDFSSAAMVPVAAADAADPEFGETTLATLDNPFERMLAAAPTKPDCSVVDEAEEEDWSGLLIAGALIELTRESAIFGF